MLLFLLCSISIRLFAADAEAFIPIAVAGHGTMLCNVSVPYTGPVWVEVNGERNATFPDKETVYTNATGYYDFVAILGDVRERSEIWGVRIVFDLYVCYYGPDYWPITLDRGCARRDIDLEFIYVHKPPRPPLRKFAFNANIRQRNEFDSLDIYVDNCTKPMEA